MDDYLKQAQEFLSKTNTTLTIEYKKFGSMSWDTDGKKRNIFECTLKNNNHSYTFEFGDSLNNSCVDVPLIETEGEAKVFYGVLLPESNLRVFTTEFFVKHRDLRRMLRGKESAKSLIDKSIVERDLEEGIQKYMEEWGKQWKKKTRRSDLPKGVARGQESKIRNQFSPEKVMELVAKRVVAKAEELQKSMDSGTKQVDKIVPPSEYSILACLYPSWFETVDDVWEEFGGDMKPSQCQAILDETNHLKKLFNEEQLNMLCEIQ